MKTEAPSARPSAAVAVDELELVRLDEARVCGDRGADVLRDETLRSDDDPPVRLDQQLPRRSPLAGFEVAWRGETDPAKDTELLPGAIEGHLTRFAQDEDRSFDVRAYRFLTRHAAAGALASQVVDHVCAGGAEALAAGARPGLVVLTGPGREPTAWWTSGTDVMQVRSGAWRDARAALTNVAAVAATATSD